MREGIHAASSIGRAARAERIDAGGLLLGVELIDARDVQERTVVAEAVSAQQHDYKGDRAGELAQ